MLTDPKMGLSFEDFFVNGMAILAYEQLTHEQKLGGKELLEHRLSVTTAVKTHKTPPK